MALQGLHSSLPSPRLAVHAIPTCRCHKCTDLGHVAGNNPAGHPGSCIPSSWPSCPAEAPLPASAQAPGYGVPWPQWAGGRPLAQPGPALPHQAHRQGAVCRSSLLWQLDKTKLVIGATSPTLGWLPSLPPPERVSPEKSTRAGHSATTHCPGAGSSTGSMETKCWADITAWRMRICPAPS